MLLEYPRILIIGPSFQVSRGGGITLTNLFKGWKKQNIAVAAERIDIVDLTVCEKFYQLGYNESKRRFPFNLIEKKYPSGEMLLKILERKNNINNIIPNSKKYIKLNKIYDLLLNFSGLFHYSRNLRITEEFKKWVMDFEPDIIYSQLEELALIRFISELHYLIKKPVTIHIMDDWPSTINKPGIFQRYWRKIIDREFREILDLSSLLLSIGDSMSEEYKYRYNKVFLPFHNPIEIEIWHSLAHKTFDKNNVKILYTGRIGLGIEKSLLEVAKAIENINNKKKTNISFILQTQTVPNWISDFKFVTQRFIDDYKLYPQSLADADILILPYDFSISGLEFIKYSFPTKASEYMISKTPIIVYASEVTAICKHAVINKWASVVSKNDIVLLENAILELIENENLREKYATTAHSFSIENFDAEKVRERFRSALALIVE
jgi:glycosyltransferase involved in cell wall biosynthesis